MAALLSKQSHLKVAYVPFFAAVFVSVLAFSQDGAEEPPGVTTVEFAREVERVLPEEPPYAYHHRLSEGPVHEATRNPELLPRTGKSPCRIKAGHYYGTRTVPSCCGMRSRTFRIT